MKTVPYGRKREKRGKESITTANSAAAVVEATAGAVVESLINDVGTKPLAEVVKNAAIDGATSVAFSWAGGKFTTKMKGSKLLAKVKKSKPVTSANR